ncbi:MAG TPA: tetratricopeptide repeat protein [Kofleriaceae bacterium]
MANPDCAADPMVLISRAIDLLAAGEPEAAEPLLEAADPSQPDAAAALAALRLHQRRPAAALAALDRAIAAEPDWPLHHWNAAVAHHQLGDRLACHQALGRFVHASERPSGLAGDPAQPARLIRAAELMSELERTARLSGTPLSARRPKRQRR